MSAAIADTLVCDARQIQERWQADFRRTGVVIPYGGDVPRDLPLVDGLRHRGYVLMVARFVPENSVPEFLFSLWQRAGAYFHGHSVGGTNPALVQAMACGAPVVARDTAFNREVLGAAGVFVAPTPPAIRDGVLSLLRAPLRQEELSRAAVERVQESYQRSKVGRSYGKPLWEIASAHGPGRRA